MEVGVVVLIVNVINIKDFCEQIRDLLSRLTIRFPTKWHLRRDYSEVKRISLEQFNSQWILTK